MRVDFADSRPVAVTSGSEVLPDTVAASVAADASSSSVDATLRGFMATMSQHQLRHDAALAAMQARQDTALAALGAELRAVRADVIALASLLGRGAATVHTN